MDQVSQGDTVRVHYTGKLSDGTVFDSSEQRGPIEFTIGSGQIIPGFEEAVLGMAPGETKSASIPSDKAYGPFRDDMVQELPREEFPDSVEVEVGRTYQVQRPDAPPMLITVVDMTEENVTVDANHPLAGKDLEFDLELVEIVTE